MFLRGYWNEALSFLRQQMCRASLSPVLKIVFCAFNRQKQNINNINPRHPQINMYSCHAVMKTSRVSWSPDI